MRLKREVYKMNRLLKKIAADEVYSDAENVQRCLFVLGEINHRIDQYARGDMSWASDDLDEMSYITEDDVPDTSFKSDFNKAYSKMTDLLARSKALREEWKEFKKELHPILIKGENLVNTDDLEIDANDKFCRFDFH